MSANLEMPVLIVGAGPAGLIAALTLRKNGIPVRIIEKELRVNVGQRGAALMPRSQEIFKILGILDDIHAHSIPMHPMRVYKLPEGDEAIATFPLEPIVEPTPYKPYGNTSLLGQNQTQAIMRGHLERLGCEVESGVALCSFQTEVDHVVAYVLRQDGDREVIETIKCRWLIGADGAKGIVRKQLGLTFDGETLGATHRMVIGDVQIKGLDADHWHSWGDMHTTLILLRPTEDPHIHAMFVGGHVDHAKIVAEPAELQRVLRVGTGRTDIELEAVHVIADYRPHVRMAETFRKGLVFVVGDAAHIHSPFGGQGLNSSIQDAVNLGWKLALVAKGIAAPSLLDSYTDERLPVIAELLRKSTELFDMAVDAKGDGVDTEKAWKRGGDLHMFGVNYRWSPIVLDERTPKEGKPVDPYGVLQSLTDVVRAGERAPEATGLVFTAGDADGVQTTSLFDIFQPSYHTVLIFSDGTDKPLQIVSALQQYPSELLCKVLIHSDGAASLPILDGTDMTLVDRDGHAHEGYQVQKDECMIVIIRPDGYIGGIASGTEWARRYFDAVFSASVHA